MNMMFRKHNSIQYKSCILGLTIFKKRYFTLYSRNLGADFIKDPILHSNNINTTIATTEQLNNNDIINRNSNIEDIEEEEFDDINDNNDNNINDNNQSSPSLPIKNITKYHKIRQHVNPLSSKYQTPIDLSPKWMYDAFQNPITNDLIIDIGCAKGSWGLSYAQLYPNSLNILGLEIRRPVVEYCLDRKNKRNLKNIHFLTVNANVDLENILISIRNENINIKAITIQFPDPHFKAKHKKRRVVNEVLVNCLAKYLLKNTMVFVQSDIEELTIDMVTKINESIYFNIDTNYNIDKLTENISPFPIQTEREIATLGNNLPVYRMLFHRNDIIYNVNEDQNNMNSK